MGVEGLKNKKNTVCLLWQIDYFTHCSPINLEARQLSSEWKQLRICFRQSTFSAWDVLKTMLYEPCQKNLATGDLIAMLFRDVRRLQRGLGTQCLECSMLENAGQDRWLMWRTKSTDLRPIVWTELVGSGHKTCTGFLVSDRLLTWKVSFRRSFLLLDISEKRFFFKAKVLFVPNVLNISCEIQEWCVVDFP